MTITIHKAGDRGEMNIGWLHARYSFSFARYYNPERMGFGSLKVCNHDVVAPGRGFDPHSHKDFEIITIPLRGSIAHKDSLGNEGSVIVGEVQTMSAGTGVTHSEFNASDSDDLELFQIWIETEVTGREPQYDQHGYDMNQFGRQIISSRDTGGYIESSAQIEYLHAENDLPIQFQKEHGYFIILIDGGGVMKTNDQSFEVKPFDSLELSELDTEVVLQKGTKGYLITM